MTDKYFEAVCTRCGRRYVHCVHVGTNELHVDKAHAARIRARYEIGKRFGEPDEHDTADYFSDPPGTVDAPLTG